MWERERVREEELMRKGERVCTSGRGREVGKGGEGKIYYSCV